MFITANGIDIQLQRSGPADAVRRLFKMVPPEACVDVLFCEKDICSAREVVMLSGTPDHRDNVLSEPARGAAML